MSFWHTVLAVVLANAIYDLIHMILFNDPEDPDDGDSSRYAT